jgi:poly-beta-1,6-N-acetyl-D-glucosamine synthase
MILGLVVVFFAFSCAALFYVYAGFPLCLLFLTRGRRHRRVRDLADEDLPSVAFLVAAYNEEVVIAKKIRNCLDLDYPADKLQLVFVSDGSTDETNEILQTYQGNRVEVVILSERRGKIRALSTALHRCKGDILVFSDANAYYRPDSIRKLMRHFTNPEVGVVTGDVRLMPSPHLFGAGEGFYYRYERMLQKLESEFWATVAIDGAMYALPRRLLRPPSSSLVPDDLVTGMNVACQGYRVIYEPGAIAEEDSTPGDAMEFWRKVRIVGSAFQALLRGEGVPSLARLRLLWIYVSHKLLRWLAPFFLVMAWLSAGVLAASAGSFWMWILALQTGFYLLALLAWRAPALRSRAFRVPYYFCMVNLAALVGIIRALRMKQGALWARTERLPQPRL